jgi:hypothetical protein
VTLSTQEDVHEEIADEMPDPPEPVVLLDRSPFRPLSFLDAGGTQ